MIKSAFIAVVSLVATSAIAQQPQSFEAGQTKRVTGTIEAVSQSDRHVTVLDNTGRRLVLKAEEGVENLAKLRQGDRVVVAYHEGLVADIVPPGQGGQSVTQRTERFEGDEPMKITGTQTTTTVEIESIDPARNLLTFKDQDGTSRTLGIANRKAKEFVSQLSPGDQVQLTYREAAAFSIQPAGGRVSSADDTEAEETKKY
jgi:antitoxin (DNA-binding transcriptional repressor) of toxin-antitoxin stability system